MMITRWLIVGLIFVVGGVGALAAAAEALAAAAEASSLTLASDSAPSPTWPTTILTATATLPLPTVILTATATLPPPTPTLTATATLPPPAPTATPTATPTLVAPLDGCEPNDSFDQPCPVVLNQPLRDLTLSPVGDQDYFAVYLKAGQNARAATFPAAGSGSDTRLFVYSQSGELLAFNEDRSPIDLGSTAAWTAATDGFYILRVESAIPFVGWYSLLVSLEGPTPTPPPTATAAPLVAPDMAAPNNRPEEAFEIVADIAYNLTLGPRGVEDEDYFKLWVKAGNRYRCTARPTGPLDPALRVYADPVSETTLLAANDDIAPGERTSQVEVVASYTGFLFVVASVEAGYGGYSLLCAVVVPPPPPVRGGRPAPTPTPTPTLTTTATLSQTTQVVVRPLPALEPEATPATVTTIRVQVIYDLNANGQPDPDEGAPNVSVRAVSRNAIVGWALTDERGVATLTILGDVDRVIVPFLAGWSRAVRPGQVNEFVLAAPAVSLPVIMPVVGEE